MQNTVIYAVIAVTFTTVLIRIASIKTMIILVVGSIIVSKLILF